MAFGASSIGNGHFIEDDIDVELVDELESNGQALDNFCCNELTIVPGATVVGTTPNVLLSLLPPVLQTTSTAANTMTTPGEQAVKLVDMWPWVHLANHSSPWVSTK